MAADPQAAYRPCLEALRTLDRDRYLAALLMPEESRGAIAALYVFNAELARIRDVVRDPMPGELRLQWWRDLAEGRAGADAFANPFAAAIEAATTAYSLPRQALARMTEARIFDLYDDPMETTVMLEGYAGETASTLIQLSALVLDAERAPDLADAAGHAGVAQLVAGILLLLPLHRRRNQLYVPLDVLSAVGLDRQAFYEGKEVERISAAISAFVGFGRDHLQKARSALAQISAGRAFDAFLPVSLAEGIFDRAGKAGASCLGESVLPAQWRRQWRLWRAHSSRRL